MPPRPTIPWPAQVLRQPAADVTEITPDIRAIWDDMIATMEAMPGYGLAAVQIGVALRLAVVDCSDARGQAVRMANPVVQHASGQFRTHEEASPNLPGVSAEIRRPRAVTVRFLNADGVVEDRDFVNLWATSVQHQIDHLAGKMYFDHLSPLKRQMLIKKSEKLRGRG
jgi:peptide deformylase